MAATALYTDGGVIRKNPSEIGGTWAWCQVADTGERFEQRSGVVTPAQIGMPWVSNNYTELLAAVEGLEQLPEGWCGVLYTDSFVTLTRISPETKKPKWKNIPDNLRLRAEAAKARAGWFKVVLLGGHPNKTELASGRRKDGLPVSQWNVWCDKACGEEARKYLEQLTKEFA